MKDNWLLHVILIACFVFSFALSVWKICAIWGADIPIWLKLATYGKQASEEWNRRAGEEDKHEAD